MSAIRDRAQKKQKTQRESQAAAKKQTGGIGAGSGTAQQCWPITISACVAPATKQKSPSRDNPMAVFDGALQDIYTIDLDFYFHGVTPYLYLFGYFFFPF